MRAAVIQMISSKSIELNLIQARELIEQAVGKGAKLVVLPENFAYFGAAGVSAVAEPEVHGSGPIAEFLAGISKAHGIWLVAGTVPMFAHSKLNLHSNNESDAPTDKVYAASTVWSPEGKCVCCYKKCHLFDVNVSDSVGQYRESDTYLAGDAPVTAELPFGLMGLSVCYDVRFPEFYRKYQEQGVSLITVPSAFTYATGKAHWDVLVRARAIENQCFVLAANQGGEHGGGRVTWGHSCIVSPWGEVLAVHKSPGPGVAVADLDFDKQARIRQQMPCLQHRKF